MGTGAFWDQVNTRVMEQFIDSAEYLLCIDYDTFFTRQDIETLFAMAMTFQCDAITGLQTKREDGRPMLTLKGTLDSPPEEGKHTNFYKAALALIAKVDTDTMDIRTDEVNVRSKHIVPLLDDVLFMLYANQVLVRYQLPMGKVSSGIYEHWMTEWE